MQRKLMLLLLTLALLLAVSVAPAYAGEDKEGGSPPCTECDGSLGGHWG